VLYEVPNLASYLRYRRENPNNTDGHSVGDPSGQRAYQEEGVFLKNKKKND
jgi:hypothetical protein